MQLLFSDSAGVKDGLSRTDELYNQSIDMMEARGLSLANA